MSTNKERFRYYKVYQDMKEKIEQGVIKKQDKLPTEKELQESYGVSRDTVRKAMSKLEQEGYISRKIAVGTFVKQTKSDYQLSTMKGFSEQMRERGIEPSSELDSIRLKGEISLEIRDMLQLNPSDKCYIICRTRFGDGIPMAYEIVYTPYALCPDIQKHLDDETSLYDVYEKRYNHELGHGSIRLEADIPSRKLQEKLGVSKDSPILLMKCLAMLKNDVPLYYVECFYIGEKYFFSTDVYR